jgi:uncharacterized membrane protein
MKRMMIFGALLTLSAIVGCGGPEGGGLGPGEGFSLGTPFFATKVQQGDRKTVTVKVKRDDYFKEDVKLEVTASPGINVEPSETVVKASDSPEVALQISAPQDAALGDYRVLVKGIPETGQSTSAEIKVKVVEP